MHKAESEFFTHLTPDARVKGNPRKIRLLEPYSSRLLLFSIFMIARTGLVVKDIIQFDGNGLGTFVIFSDVPMESA
jgi:hypothetical protein